jgi:hypothetical protein
MKPLIAALLALVLTSRNAGESIKVICFDINNNKVLEEYRLYGGKYAAIMIDAKELDNYFLVGSGQKNVVLGVDDEALFLYEEAKDYRTHKSYISGFPDGRFYPDQTVTWAEGIYLLYSVKELPKKEIPPFNKNVWHDEAYQYFKTYGYITDFFPDNPMTKKSFTNLAINFIDKHANKNVIDAYLQIDAIDNEITRGECVWVVNRLLKRDKEITTPAFHELYKDVPESHPLYRDIIEASINHDYIDADKEEKWLAVYK